MKAILICPSERNGVPFLGTTTPLSNIPMMGHGLLEYWLSFLACARAKEVLVLAQDRAEQVKALVEDGARWGLKVEVSAKARELTPEEAQSQYEPDSTVFVLDHFPEMPEKPLFTSYSDWFAAMQGWMPRAKTPDRAGVREIQPGVWAGRHCNISKAAYLQAPCWLGDHVYVGSAATIGPGSILEDGAFIEPKARIINSYVAPDTFIGRYVQVKDSIAWGETLINWQTSLEIKVPDSFLMCSLRPASPKQKQGIASWKDRIVDFWNDLQTAEQAVQEPVLIGVEKNRQSRG